MPSVYILYSQSKDSFYIGFTSVSAADRINRHIEDYYQNKYTASTKDWELYLEIICDSVTQGLQIEKHIKRMKSKKYITNLNKYSQIVEKLKEKYSGT